MKAGVPRETFPGENRVAIVPTVVQSLVKAGFEVLLESGAGLTAGFPDGEYKAARIVSRAEALSADVVLQVRGLGANLNAGMADLEGLKQGQIVIGFMEPLSEPKSAAEYARKGVTAFAMELMPRTTRAQSMDALSSMATVAGYKAVLIAAELLPKMFPMLMTAAGTINPARVLIIGAGVAGLQAIGTAKRLGAVVSGYDIRPVVKEQVQSLGAKFVELPLETKESEGAGGYAKQMGEEFYKKQRELLGNVLAENDIVITTAAVPGKRAPILITREMAEKMKPGSVIVDLAAERGGNCELTKPGENVVHNGITIAGPVNVPSTVPFHASQMYAKNIVTFLLNMTKDGKVPCNLSDDIVKETMMTMNGEVVHPKIKELLTGGK